MLKQQINPFDEGKGQVWRDNRVTERRKGKKRKSRFSYKQNHEDPEIQAEIIKEIQFQLCKIIRH